MDRQTKNYRKIQVKKLVKNKYGISLKLCSSGGDTHFIAITNKEYQAIKKILIEGVE